MPNESFVQRVRNCKSKEGQTDLLNKLLEMVTDDFFKTLRKYHAEDIPVVLGFISAQVKFLESDMNEDNLHMMKSIESSVCRIAVNR